MIKSISGTCLFYFNYFWHLLVVLQTVTTLRQQLMIRPSTKEVTQLVDSQLQLLQLKRTDDNDSNRDGGGSITSLRADVAELRSSVERRATVRWVEEALKRKLNKTDVHLAQNIARPSVPAPSPSFSDLMQVSDELKSKLERSDRRHKEAQQQLGASFVTSEDLEEKLRGKADRTAVEQVLALHSSAVP